MLIVRMLNGQVLDRYAQQRHAPSARWHAIPLCSMIPDQ
jgi:hypothetical protein